MNTDDRPRTIPELRGMSVRAEERERERNREKPYSAASYSAQYGITLGEAEDILTSGGDHSQCVRQIMALFSMRPERRDLAIRGAEVVASAPKEVPEGGWPEVAGFSTPGMILGDSQVRAFSEPGKMLTRKMGAQKARALVESAEQSPQFEEWLQECIARGDHNLVSERFHLDDVPKPACKPLRLLLAARYLESEIGKAATA